MTIDLSAIVSLKLHEAFDAAATESLEDFYDQVMAPCEAALLTYLQLRLHGNQVQMASTLGINRNTLRKKLDRHGLLNAVPRTRVPRVEAGRVRLQRNLHHLRAARRAAALAGVYAEGGE